MPFCSFYVDILDIHLPHLIGCVNANNGFHNPPGRTAVIVCIVEEIVLLQYAEDLLPVDYISGSLQVFADLLVTIADEFLAQQIRNIKQDLSIYRAWSPQAQEGKRTPEEDHSREGA